MFYKFGMCWRFMINLKGVVFGIAVFVLTLFVSIYGVNMVYDRPEYNDFCSVDLYKGEVQNESSCVDVGGSWSEYDKVGSPDLAVRGYCDRDYMCREAYDLKSERYSMNLFLLSVPLGILILIGGFFVALEFVSVGVMVAGVGTILRGVGGYWRYSEDWLRFLISLVGLGVVIYFSYRYMDKK